MSGYCQALVSSDVSVRPSDTEVRGESQSRERLYAEHLFHFLVLSTPCDSVVLFMGSSEAVLLERMPELIAYLSRCGCVRIDTGGTRRHGLKTDRGWIVGGARVVMKRALGYGWNRPAIS